MKIYWFIRSVFRLSFLRFVSKLRNTHARFVNHISRGAESERRYVEQQRLIASGKTWDEAFHIVYGVENAQVS